MTPMTSTAITLQNFVYKNLDTKGTLPFKTVVKTFPKGTVLLEQGASRTESFLIISGIIQASGVLLNNKDEKIYEFLTENEFVGDVSFFLPKKPSLYALTCITDCTLELVSMADYSKALSSSLLVNHLSRYILEYWHIKRIKKEVSITNYSAEERYKRLFISRPELIKQLPIAKIAQYLNVQPNSLSRIRKFLNDAQKSEQ
jgi:CRP-like cAMP-binding protein